MDERELSDYAWLEWARAQDIFPGKSLFGDGISPDDIDQGGLGNCWFLAAISAIAEKPGRMEKVFLQKENYLNQAGIYGFNFFTLGVPHTVVIDDYLPVETDSRGKKGTVFTSIGDDSSLWGPLIEKAFAKYWGNYGHIVGGASQMAVRTMLGGVHMSHDHASMTIDQIWEILHENAQTDTILTAGSNGESDEHKNTSGLVEGHAYTILKTVILSNKAKLV